MRFEVHTPGTPGTATLLASRATFDCALRDFAGVLAGTAPDNERAPWAIIPAGRADELAELGPLYSIAPRYNGGCYVLKSGGGISCLGFAVADAKRSGVAAWLESEGIEPPTLAAPLGTPGAWLAYHETMAAGEAHHKATFRKCPADLCPELVRHEGRHIRATDRFGERRAFTVGRSMGWMPCHLEIAPGDDGGAPAFGPYSDIERIY